ncbi:penicillin-binding protein 2 [Sesbania bispinosa]|nr:penicillin-binding protein 2 [Sesbania bispinosa]
MKRNKGRDEFTNYEQGGRIFTRKSEEQDGTHFESTTEEGCARGERGRPDEHIDLRLR